MSVGQGLSQGGWEHREVRRVWFGVRRLMFKFQHYHMLATCYGLKICMLKTPWYLRM